MIHTSEFQKGVYIKVDGQPWTIVDFQFVKPGKGAAFVRTKLKNLITGNDIDRSFKSSDQFEEVDVEKIKAKYLYFHRDRFFFCKEEDASFRFDLPKESIGSASKFLKANQIVDTLLLEGKIINVSLPIKIQLKVTEAPPSFKGNTAQGGTKTVTLETGGQINVPLFINQGDVIEINTETGEYVKRTE